MGLLGYLTKCTAHHDPGVPAIASLRGSGYVMRELNSLVSALYEMRKATSPKPSRYLSAFCAARPATIESVVGSDAAHTPGCFAMCDFIGEASSPPVRPGMMSCTWPDMASSPQTASTYGSCSSAETPSMACLVGIESTHPITKLTGDLRSRPPAASVSLNLLKLSFAAMSMLCTSNTVSGLSSEQ
eukprot:scaffold15247_cov128-Isochrysis_galbana.AAC.3